MVHQSLLARPGQSDDKGLQIVVLQGDGATHLVNHHAQEYPVVSVRKDGQPVRGAAVTFQLPESGPSGSFFQTENYGSAGKTSKSIQMTTNKAGRAEAKSFTPNKELGAYAMQVTASFEGQTAKTELKQTNAWSEAVRVASRKQRNNLMIGLVVLAAIIIALAMVAPLTDN
jgi:hypothetical protein